MSLTVAALSEALEALAPLAFAEPWDNVGLLLPGREDQEVQRVVLTIDVTDGVLEEAIELEANVIVAYHPVLFEAKKRFRRSVASERVALRAIEGGIAIYSPHTALDAAKGGLNDWLADAIGAGAVRPILAATSDASVGQGRVLELSTPAALDSIASRAKAHLDVPTLRIAVSERHAQGEPIRTAAVAAGAGGPVLMKSSPVDLFVTGEMRHHDVLAAVESGTSVILAEHTGSERGFLPVLAGRLRERLARSAEVFVSARDRDPVTSQK